MLGNLVVDPPFWEVIAVANFAKWSSFKRPRVASSLVVEESDNGFRKPMGGQHVFGGYAKSCRPFWRSVSSVGAVKGYFWRLAAGGGTWAARGPGGGGGRFFLGLGLHFLEGVGDPLLRA